MIFKIKTSDATSRDIGEKELLSIVGNFIMERIKEKKKLQVPVINNGRTILFDIEAYNNPTK